MKKLLANCTMFAAPIVLFWLLVGILVRHLPTDYAFKNNVMTTCGSGIETLILGSSHSYYGIQAKALSPTAFNAANVSQTLDYDLWTLEHYTPYLPKLKRVILPISYFSYLRTLANAQDQFRGRYYRIYCHKDDGFHFDAYFEPFDTFKLDVGRDFDFFVRRREPRICDDAGSGTGYTLDRRASNWMDDSAFAAKRHTVAYDQKTFAGNADHVRRMIEFCKSRNISICLVTLPAHASYREHIDAAQFRMVVAQSSRFASEYGIPYLNYFCDPRFTDADFFDGDHLNAEGARKMGSILSDAE